MNYVYTPNTVNQVSDDPENEISWRFSPTTLIGCLRNAKWMTVKPLVHISNPACGDIGSQTVSLVCTNLNATELPDVITGISLRVSGQRNGRVVDKQIQLTYQGNTIGENKVDYETDSEGHIFLSNDTTYGGETDLWGVELTKEMIQDPSFGVILKFQNHPFYPHSCGMLLETVSITVY